MPAACTQDEPADGKGIDHDMTGTGEATQVEGSTTWETAMNTALSNAGWQYATGSGDAPLTLQRQ